jgi:hypothetical protein
MTIETRTPTPITETHLELVRDMAAQGQYLSRSIEHYAQEIADSEARAWDQLRAEVELWELAFQEQFARADRAEAELAAERARLDWLEKSDPDSLHWWTVGEPNSIRDDIDAAMKEGAK